MRILLLSFVLVLFAVFAYACGGASINVANSTANTAANTGPIIQSGNTPTESYKKLYAAVKSKNVESIKQLMTQTTQEFAVMAAERNNAPIEKVYENGFTATTFSESLPEIRDERINGDNGAVEVWNARENKWDDLPFVKDPGGWKLAVGDLFKGSWKSPGKGMAVREMEAANASGTSQPKFSPAPQSNSMSNTAIQVPKPVNK